MPYHTVGGPLETSCQLEGVLETIESRRKELQRDLDETVRIEEQLRRQILAEFNLKEPNYPVITDAPKLEFNSSNSTDSLMDPSTPKTAVKTYKEMQSPDFLPFNPHSFDNTDLCGPGLPRYRSSRGAASFDDNFGCGAAGALFDATADLSGSGATALIEGGSAAAAAAMRDRNRFGGGAGRQQGGNRSRSHSPINGNQHQTGFGGPTLTSSFDTIDFRTGMSGHRGLNNSKLNAGNSPTPRGSFLRMSEHVGIGRVRGPLQRSSASNAS